MRGLLLKLFQEHGISVRVGDIDLPELWQADGLFLTNSLIGIWPVRELAGHRFRLGLPAQDLVQQALEYAFTPKSTDPLR